jgi:glutaconate CoA-transferase subunit A
LLWGIVGVQKEVVMAARRSIVTVEEIVEQLEPRANSVVLPGWVVGAVCEVPGGAFPSYALGYYPRDNSFYQQWDEIARERQGFTDWIERNVLAAADFAEFRRRIAPAISPAGGKRPPKAANG